MAGHPNGETAMAAKGNDRQIDNIEFRVGDIGRATEFYARAFGWTFTDYGPTYCEFSDGRLTAGLTTAGSATPGGALVILYADDLEATQARLENLGAKIIKPIFAFPGGRRFHFLDPDGYELAVWTKR
jgi:uncharacterized protein